MNAETEQKKSEEELQAEQIIQENAAQKMEKQYKEQAKLVKPEQQAQQTQQTQQSQKDQPTAENAQKDSDWYADEKGPDTEKMTKGVADLLGNPKKALIKISIPVMVALVFQAVYNLVDTFWVAGLGEEALAAVGLVFPFFLGLMALATGVGVGAGSAISRSIGAKDKKKADNFATHAIVLGVILSFVCWLAIPIMKPIFSLMGADASLASVAAGYINIFIVSVIFIFLLNIGNSILNSEGNSRKTMFATIAGALLNCVLDPIFIYDWGLGLGVNGAAYASVVSFAVSMLMVMYWLLIERKTYVTITLRKFKFDMSIVKEIFSVGIPVMISQLTMSISTIFLSAIVLNVGGTSGAAIYTTGWRIVSMGIMPMLGFATGMTTMAGVSYGGHDIKKLKDVYYFAIMFGMALELIIAILIFVFAEPIAAVFATGESLHLHDSIVEFLRYMFLLFLFFPAGMLTSSMLQGLRMGKWSLALTLLRTIVFEVPFAYLLSITFGYGLVGVWIGLLVGDFLMMVVSFTFGNLIIKKLKHRFKETGLASMPAPAAAK
ncbi:Multidrug export protein MepA [Methanosarcinaceae archaeon Ag5]|uniref:Multidrug export protein MepA n=1 Tax=Methanolapillus africanus TaxID=3028297 RepID=A0AAE4ML97_9EURY|nr:Multidrug export protein MepA [Methanosarcinaceae archaeon Ag5]